jgi:cold shock protein
MTGERVIGMVRFYQESRQFGFVAPDDGGADYHISAGTLRRNGIDTLRPGDRVEFLANLGERGRYASDVRLLSESDVRSKAKG